MDVVSVIVLNVTQPSSWTNTVRHLIIIVSVSNVNVDATAVSRNTLFQVAGARGSQATYANITCFIKVCVAATRY